MDAVSEIKSRLNIEDVISQYVQLKRAGRNFKGLSPFTNEKTPSFIVSPEKQIWHDFSSGKGGDAFSFVMEVEGLDFKGAPELLARQAGVDLEQYSGQQNDGRSHLKSRVLEALQLAAKFYQKQLTANNAALKYLLKDRNFSKKTLLTWEIGYAPNVGHALTDFLTKKGFTTDEMKAAGIVTTRFSHPADMFRGCIMIPLADSRGTVIGFTARLLADEPDSPKYINTPQTIVYDKSRHVFGLHLAKEAIRKTGFSVITEGNLDVISSHQAGVFNVVATAGTAITDKHLKELKRFGGDIRLAFDADSAGLTATERAISLAQQVDVSLNVINYGGAKDPDELIQKDPKAWEQTVGKSQYAVDWLIDRYVSQLDLTSSQGKKAFTDALLDVVRKLRDPIEQEHYLKKIAEVADSSLETVRAKFSKQAGAGDLPRRRPKVAPGPLDQSLFEYQRLQDHFLGMALSKPKLRHLLENSHQEYFTDGPPRAVYNFLKKHPAFKGEPQLAKELQGVSDYVKIITLQFEELYQDVPAQDLGEQATQLKHRLITRYAKIQKQLLARAMEQTTDQAKLQQLMRKADKLNKLIKVKRGE